MLDLEYVENDYSILLDGPELESGPKIAEESSQQEKTSGSASRDPENRLAWWSIEYYQRFFDVTSQELLNRLIASMKPLPPEDFLLDVLQEKPDLYGPFWTCATLAIETGLSSNAAYFFQNHGHRSWRQTVQTAYQAAVLLFLYCWCLPTMLWIGLEWNPVSTYKFRLPELWCVFGYATTILVPAAAIWALPIIWLRWLAATMAVFVSGIFICRYLKRAFCQLERSNYYTVQTLFFALNCLVGYFFVVLFYPSTFKIDMGGHILEFVASMSTIQNVSLTSKIVLPSHSITGFPHLNTSRGQ